MKPPLSYVPAMPAAVGLMAGIVIFDSCESWLAPVAALIAGASAFGFKRHWLSFAAFFVALGWLLSAADRPSQPPDDILGVRCDCAGTVSNIHITPSATRLTVEIDSVGGHAIAPFKSAVLLPTPTEHFIPGDRLNFTARLYDPDLSSDLPDENRFNPTYFVNGITAQANVSPDDVTVTGSRRTLKRVAYDWQTTVRDLIYDSPISSQTAWFLSATLIGDDSLLDPTLRQQFRATGAAHYLALSGFHIGIIALIASTVLFPLKIWSRAGRLRHLLVIAVIWFYAFTCGMSPSLVRAAVLITVFLLAKVLQRQSSPYNSLCAAAIVILTFSPRQLFAPGFQLSFCAVLSILAFSEPLNPFKDRRSRLHRMASFVTVPVAAMLGTCLVSMFHFHRFPLLFLIPNLLLAVLLPLLLTTGVILMISSAMGLKLTFVGLMTDFIYESICSICELSASYPDAEIRGIFLSPLTIFFAFIAIILFAVSWQHRRRLMLILSAGALASAILTQLFQPSLPTAELYITRQPQRTDIVVRDADSVIVFTTARKSDHQSISERLSLRYGNYLSRRNCENHFALTDSDFTLQSIAMRDNYIVFGNKILFMPTAPDNPVAKQIDVDYLILSRAAGGKPYDFVKAVGPDTVIISRDMPPLRAQKLIDSCEIHNMPYLYLKNRPFSLIISK